MSKNNTEKLNWVSGQLEPFDVLRILEEIFKVQNNVVKEKKFWKEDQYIKDGSKTNPHSSALSFHRQHQRNKSSSFSTAASLVQTRNETGNITFLVPLADLYSCWDNGKPLSLNDYFEKDGVTSPDLLIRTSGEKRISNFLLWHLAYTEFYFSDVYWPDFSEKVFVDALKFFSAADRRYGKEYSKETHASVN